MNLGAAVPATRVRVRAAQPALASSFMGGKVLSRSADLCELRSAKGAAPAGRQTQEVRVLAHRSRGRAAESAGGAGAAARCAPASRASGFLGYSAGRDGRARSAATRRPGARDRRATLGRLAEAACAAQSPSFGRSFIGQ